MSTVDWHQWCRLCAKDDVFGNVNVHTQSQSLAMSIGKYFWVEIKWEDELSNYVCGDCLRLVNFLIEFSERVQRVQKLFGKLQNSKSGCNFEELRAECGLQSGEWQHIFSVPRDSKENKSATESQSEMQEMDVLMDELHEVDEIIAEIEEEEHLKMESHTETSEDDTVVPNNPESDLSGDEMEKELDLVESEAEDELELYKCDICPRSYKNPMTYKQHMEQAHDLLAKDLPDTEEKANNVCPLCSNQFATTGSLNRHIARIHEQGTSYICDICGKSLKSISSLKDHKLVHTEECPFECPECHRRFKTNARLRVHADTHTEGYECSVCGLKLSTRRTLSRHQAVHSENRRFKCDVCQATFKRSKTLKNHLVLHTGIRPYKCNFCKKDFTNGSNCRTHKRRTHPKELAEEEAQGVLRSTLLPMIDELNKASKRIKTPARKPSKRKEST